jgi:hypothetical protein
MATRRKTLGPANLGRGGLLTSYRPPAPRPAPLGPTNLGRGGLLTNTPAVQLAQQRQKLWGGLPAYLQQTGQQGVMAGQQTPPGQPQAPNPANQFAPDAQYLAEAAQRQFDRIQAMNALTSQAGSDQNDTSEAIRRLLAGAPEQRQTIKQNANRQGLFYSGQLGKQLNSYEADLTQRQGDIQLDFDARERARAAARAALEQGAPLEEAAGLAEAAARQVQRDTDAAAVNALAPPPAAPALKSRRGGLALPLEAAPSPSPGKRQAASSTLAVRGA